MQYSVLLELSLTFLELLTNCFQVYWNGTDYSYVCDLVHILRPEVWKIVELKGWKLLFAYFLDL